MSLCASSGGEVFRIAELIPKLCTSSGIELKCLGCPNFFACAGEVVTDYVFIKKLRKEGRCKFDEEQILINYPGARNQLHVLRKCLSDEVRHKRWNCEACSSIPIAVDFDNEEEGDRLGAVLVDPSTPQDLLESEEIVDSYLNTITDPKQREAFKRHVVEEFSHKEVAEQMGVKVERVRQWSRRNTERLAKRLNNAVGRTIPRRSHK